MAKIYSACYIALIIGESFLLNFISKIYITDEITHNPIKTSIFIFLDFLDWSQTNFLN